MISQTWRQSTVEDGGLQAILSRLRLSTRVLSRVYPAEYQEVTQIRHIIEEMVMPAARSH
jgi:hypothetical protein